MNSKKIFVCLSLISPLFLGAAKAKGNSSPRRQNTITATREVKPSPKPKESTLSLPDNTTWKRNALIHFGVGLSSYGLPLHATSEFFINRDVSVGMGINWSRYSYSTFGIDQGSWTFIYGGLRGNYHFNHLLNINPKKYDLYAGATLGYWYGTYSYQSIGSSNFGNTAYVSVQAGASYYFSKHFGLYGEMGGGNIVGATFGITAGW